MVNKWQTHPTGRTVRAHREVLSSARSCAGNALTRAASSFAWNSAKGLKRASYACARKNAMKTQNQALSTAACWQEASRSFNAPSQHAAEVDSLCKQRDEGISWLAAECRHLKPEDPAAHLEVFLLCGRVCGLLVAWRGRAEAKTGAAGGARAHARVAGRGAQVHMHGPALQSVPLCHLRIMPQWAAYYTRELPSSPDTVNAGGSRKSLSRKNVWHCMRSAITFSGLPQDMRKPAKHEDTGKTTLPGKRRCARTGCASAPSASTCSTSKPAPPPAPNLAARVALYRD